MARIIQQPKVIPGHLRRLIYTSILLSFISFGLSMVFFGFFTYFVAPVAAFLTWIYHLVLIIMHNKACRSSDTPKYQLLWLNTHAIIWGYALAILWTAAFSLSVWHFNTAFIEWSRDEDFVFHDTFIISFVEMAPHLASAAVMWALVGLATHYRRTGKWKSEQAQLQRRAGPREWVNERQPQEQSQFEGV
ncbi:hypothetical protein DL96DRAFT_1590633 [Flagelloscypha sp. PMI_526]|nr:hypothetical protein DL96DRAFT_1590633 [Flagelloscypha sp. PMI_526]